MHVSVLPRSLSSLILEFQTLDKIFLFFLLLAQGLIVMLGDEMLFFQVEQSVCGTARPANPCLISLLSALSISSNGELL